MFLHQHLCGGAEALVLQQTVDQLHARIVKRPARVRITRQQHLRLDVDQGRGHVEELGADVDIHLASLIEIRQVLRGDGGDWDVLDVDLLFADQVQQQIQGALILRQVNIQRRRHFY